MKGIIKKFHKYITVAMCCILVFETVKVSGFEANAEELSIVETVSDNETASGGDVAKENAKSEMRTGVNYLVELANQTVGLADSAKSIYQYYAAERKMNQAEESLTLTMTAATTVRNAFNGYVAQYGEDAELAVLVQEALDMVATAQQRVEHGWVSIQGKPIFVNFYILNRGLEKPEEVHSYQSNNYSKGVQGILRSGAVNADGVYESYIDDYKNGVAFLSQAEFSKYFVSVPNVDKFGEKQAEFILQDGEYVEWYVIKTESDGIHVDGIILGSDDIDDGNDDNNDDADDTDDNNDNNDDNDDADDTDDNNNNNDDVDNTDDNNDNTGDVDDTNDNNNNNDDVNDTDDNNDNTGDVDDTNNNNNEADDSDNNAADDNANAGNANAGNANVAQNADAAQNTTVTPVQANIQPVNPTPAQGNQNAAAQQVTVIDDEETPLAGNADDVEDGQNVDADDVEDGQNNDAEVVEIEDEEAPLAAGHGHCWIHWLILILTVIYTVYELVRCINRNKKINELKEEADKVEA